MPLTTSTRRLEASAAVGGFGSAVVVGPVVGFAVVVGPVVVSGSAVWVVEAVGVSVSAVAVATSWLSSQEEEWRWGEPRLVLARRRVTRGIRRENLNFIVADGRCSPEFVEFGLVIGLDNRW